MSQDVTKSTLFAKSLLRTSAHRVTSAFLWISKRVLLAPGQLYYNEGNATKCNKMQHFLKISPTNVAHMLHL